MTISKTDAFGRLIRTAVRPVIAVGLTAATAYAAFVDLEAAKFLGTLDAAVVAFYFASRPNRSETDA